MYTDPTSVPVKIPPAKQISNFLAADRRRRFGAVDNVTIESLRVATEKFQDLLEDIGDGYVIDATFNDAEGAFVIVRTTRRLFEHDGGCVLHCDCTYKCMWNRLLVTIMGFSDKDRTFHPIIVGLSTRETSADFVFM